LYVEYKLLNNNLFILASRSPPPRPPLPSDEELSASPAPPRPPLPTLEPTDEENYDKDLPIPQSNQPILVRLKISNEIKKTNKFLFRWLHMIYI